MGFLVSKSNLSWHFFTQSFSISKSPSVYKTLNLCADQQGPFTDAPHVPQVQCTVTLINPQLALTASHCFEHLSCDQAQIVFEDLAGQRTSTSFSKKQVYGCRRLKLGGYLKVPTEKRRKTDRAEDYALIELDRVVKHISPPSIKILGANGISNIRSLGYPFGRSLTLNKGKVIPTPNALPVETLFVTNLSGAYGQSGGPVYDEADGKLVGLLLGGGQPLVPRFIHPKSCIDLVFCEGKQNEWAWVEDRFCRGTTVVKIRPEMLQF